MKQLLFACAFLCASFLWARFTAVDPEREFVNSYSYTGNNPLNLIDPDGKQVSVHRQVRKGKKDIVTINVYGKLKDDTTPGSNGRGLTKREMRKVKRQIVRQFKKTFSGKGSQIIFKGKLHLSIASDEKKISPHDHVFRVVDNGAIPGTGRRRGILGRAPFGQKIIYLNRGIVGRTPAKSGPHAGTGRTAQGGGTMARTGTHEIGHSMQLRHPVTNTNAGNLMHQTRRSNAGLKVTEHQILSIESAYKANQLNGPQQR
ncbi:hypothetical protein [Acanthopleuribacter pedis]|uniref:RHS repeat-associated core domain-containing protein n=1 Tax=Acanthopleuribacter pedis TaxID=442870 RepID=A0A8J7QJ89_9BACT|nr:hypothetical protein [Acanthopleuribacter pedis]MBO1321821.1 hypothetical protein [Acanthopleuribacter pedis]